MSDLSTFEDELNFELSRFSVEHCEGGNKSAIDQRQLNRCSLAFLNRLREYQEEQVIANQSESVAMRVNLRMIEAAIAINEPVSEQADELPRDEFESSEPELAHESVGPAEIMFLTPPAPKPHSLCPCRNVYLGYRSHRPGHCLLPMNRRTPDQVPPGPMSTIFVWNINQDATESEVVNLLNTVNGRFDEGCTALTAVNVLYHKSSCEFKRPSGQAYAMYASPELAKFAADELDGVRYSSNRVLRARVSSRRLECVGSRSGNKKPGRTRWGEDIFSFPPGY